MQTLTHKHYLFEFLLNYFCNVFKIFRFDVAKDYFRNFLYKIIKKYLNSPPTILESIHDVSKWWPWRGGGQNKKKKNISIKFSNKIIHTVYNAFINESALKTSFKSNNSLSFEWLKKYKVAFLLSFQKKKKLIHFWRYLNWKEKSFSSAWRESVF